MSIPFGTFCTGIGAPEVAARGLGFHPVFVSEIEPFPCAVLAHRFGAGRPANMPSPDEAGLDVESAQSRRAAIKSLDKIKWGETVPNYGDFTKIDDEALQAIRILVAGTPCQAFSVAGLRNSLDDARGNLTLEFVKKVHAAKSLFCAAWENVPGVLSTKDNAFGCFLGALVGADDALRSPLERGRWPDSGMVSGPRGRAAWIVKDAQYFGVPQRRRRVFLIFCPSTSGGDPAAILFEPKGMHGDIEAGCNEGQDIAGTLSSRASGGGGLGTDFDLSGGLQPVASEVITFDRQSSGEYGTAPVASTISARDYKSPSDLVVSGPLTAGMAASGCRMPHEQGALIPVSYAIQERAVSENPNAGPQGAGWNEERAYTLEARHHVQAVAHTLKGEDYDASEDGTGRQNLIPVAYRTSGNNGAWDTGDRVDAITTFTDPNTHIIAFGSKDHGADFGYDISPTLRASNSVNSHPNAGAPPAIAFALRGRDGGAQPEYEGELVGALRAANGGSSRSYVAQDAKSFTISNNSGGFGWESDVAATIDTTVASCGNQFSGIRAQSAVRRLTTVECARLQGFPDDHTQIPFGTAKKLIAEELAYLRLTQPDLTIDEARLLAADGPQYKAYGNSMAVPVIRWLWIRIREDMKRAGELDFFSIEVRG